MASDRYDSFFDRPDAARNALRFATKDVDDPPIHAFSIGGSTLSESIRIASLSLYESARNSTIAGQMIPDLVDAAFEDGILSLPISDRYAKWGSRSAMPDGRGQTHVS
jgi:hypothetical protein